MVALGYSIILTKAIGTGTILAADMRGLVSGSDMKETFHSMVQSNSIAAKILGNRFKFSDGDSRKYHCMACTDVTGFGLLGHLIEMIQQADHQDDDYNEDNDDTVVAANHKKKKLAVDLYLKQVPALPGAIECVRAGILSTLHPQNIRCNQAVSNIEEASRSEIYPLLFDPQVRSTSFFNSKTNLLVLMCPRLCFADFWRIVGMRAQVRIGFNLARSSFGRIPVCL